MINISRILQKQTPHWTDHTTEFFCAFSASFCLTWWRWSWFVVCVIFSDRRRFRLLLKLWWQHNTFLARILQPPIVKLNTCLFVHKDPIEATISMKKRGFKLLGKWKKKIMAWSFPRCLFRGCDVESQVFSCRQHTVGVFACLLIHQISQVAYLSVHMLCFACICPPYKEMIYSDYNTAELTNAKYNLAVTYLDPSCLPSPPATTNFFRLT